MITSEARFYQDSLIVEIVLGNPALIKKADLSAMLSGAGSKISNFVQNEVAGGDKASKVINMLAPGTIFELLNMLGIPKIGLLVSVVLPFFGVDIGGMVERLWKVVKDNLSKGQMVHPSEIDQAAQEATTAATPKDESEANSPISLAQELRDARLIRLALEQYEYQIYRLTKDNYNTPLTSFAAGRAAKSVSIFGRILAWLFKIVLYSSGFLLAGKVLQDATNYHPQQNNQSGQPSDQSQQTSAPEAVSTQTKFPKNPSYQPESPSRPWVVNVSNDPSSIQSMLIQFAKDVYSDLDGKEGIITNSPSFQAVKDQIVWYNHRAAGEPIVYIPSMYANKQAIVDHFIDEVAKNSP